MIQKTDIVKKVSFKEKGIFLESAAETLKERINNLTLQKSALAKKHVELMELSEYIKKESDSINKLLPLIELEYETKEVEDKVYETCNLLINNPDDARNGYGRS